MGAIDLVVQVEAPQSVASGLQRVGRAGHQVGEPSNEDIEKFKYAWGEDGLPCKDVSRLVPTMEKLLEELLEELQ